MHDLPALLVWGQQDAVVPRGSIEAYRRVLAGAQVAEIPAVGHRPEIENAEAFISSVRTFLAS